MSNKKKMIKKPRPSLRAAIAAGKKVARLETKALKRAALARIGLSNVTVDKEAGIIRNAAVMTVGPARGHGFNCDMTTLEQMLELINADPEGYKIHFKHPAILEDADGNEYADDQLGEMVGRLMNGHIDGNCLRADVHLGEYAKKLPKIGNAWDYLLDVADEDPGAIGLSAVFSYDLVPVMGSDGKPKTEAGLVARVDQLFQVDFVGDPAANPNGLLSRRREPMIRVARLGATAAEVGTVVSELASIAKDEIVRLRALVDAYVAVTVTPESLAALLTAITAAWPGAQAVTERARMCVDLINQVERGTMIDQATSNSANELGKVLDLLEDQLQDAVQYLDPISYGTSELAKAAASCMPYLQTCMASIDDAERSLWRVNYATAVLARRRIAQGDLQDRLAVIQKTKVSVLARRLKAGKTI